MTGQRDKLINFVSKFISTVKLNNDHFAATMGYEDLQVGNILISRVYYVEGLGHNLFSVGQFCDSDLEVEFRKHICFIHNLEGVDLLSGSHGSNLYTISLNDMMKFSPIILLSKASKTKSWLWHHHLSHLNSGRFIIRTSLTGFPAQSVRSSNADALDSLILKANTLLILIILKTFECLWLHTLHAKPRENEFKSFSGQCLSEYIRQLILCPHETQLNHSLLHLFSDEMMSDVDVLRPGVLDVVAA
ncbi:hypothetical protein Tco_1156052 [Tanacetum coccineum]